MYWLEILKTESCLSENPPALIVQTLIQSDFSNVHCEFLCLFCLLRASVRKVLVAGYLRCFLNFFLRSVGKCFYNVLHSA